MSNTKNMQKYSIFCAVLLSVQLFAQAAQFPGLPNRFSEENFKFEKFEDNASPYAGPLPPAPSGCADFEVEQPVFPENFTIVNAADFGFSEENQDCAAALNAAIEHCKKIGASKLELPQGVFKCFGADGVLLDSLENFVLDGKGATLIFRKTKGNPNFSITNSKRIKICNLKMDWDWESDPLGAFVKVVGKHVDRNSDSYIDVEFVGYEKYPLYGKPMPIKVLYLMDEKCEGVSNERGVAYFGTGDGHYGTKNEWLSPNKARIYPGVAPVGLPRPEDYPNEYSKSKNFWISSRAMVGRTYRIMHHYYGKNAFSMRDSKHLTFENIDVYSCRGMGFIVSYGTEYWQALNVAFVPKKGSNRPCSTTADVVHCTSNGGFCKFVNFRASLNQDDIFNFHDKAAVGKKISTDKIALVNMGGARYINACEGDEMEFFLPDYSPLNFKAKVVSVAANTLKFDSALPNFDNFVLQKKSHRTQNILLKNCLFKNYVGRGIVQTSNVTIENCTFENGINSPLRFQRAYSAKNWAEGYGCKNVVVRGCKFIDSELRQPLYEIFHEIFAGSRRIDKSSDFLKSETASDILVENCDFKNLTASPLFCLYAQNVVFRNNSIELSPKAKPYVGCPIIEHSDNVAFVNNKFYVDTAANLGAYVGIDSKNAIISGNSVITQNSEIGAKPQN